MQLRQTHAEPTRNSHHTEPRYDMAELAKVTALAQRLQARHGDTLTAAEIESIGVEVGLRPEFVRDAIRQVCAPCTPPTTSAAMS